MTLVRIAPDNRQVVHAAGDIQADIFLYSITGQRLWYQHARFDAGMSSISVTSTQGGIQVMVILIDGKVAYSQKLLF
jgi:hypothetical protein